MTPIVITAEKPVFGGDSLTWIEGKALFLPGLIPGEVAQVELVSRQKDYDRAQVLSILEPSPHRITPACPYYASCGGCTMLHVEGGFQRELRRQVLQDLFQREAVAIPSIDTAAAETVGYRCRMQLHDGGLLERGKGKAVIPITSCACATAEINSWLQQIPPEQRTQHHPGRIQIFGDRRVCGGQQVLWASTQRSQNSLQVTGKSRRKVQDKVRRRFSGTVASPATTWTVQLTPGNCSPKMISFDVRGFFQSNLAVLEQAITLLLEYVEEIKTATGKSTLAHALDIYSGAGTIAAFLADHFQMMTLVEHNRDALVFAQQNLMGKAHQSYGVSGEQWSREFAPALLKGNLPELAFVDPPRSGMEPAMRRFLAQSGIPRIAYLSCNPATQTRDCAILEKAGYRVKKLYLLDFYPNTGHMETLALLER